MQYIRSVLANRVTIAASAVQDFNLPPNPLSHILITIRWQTDAVNVVATIENILATLTTVEVLHRGSTVVSIDFDDLYALNAAIMGHSPLPMRNTAIADESACQMGLIIPFGRRLYDPNECFPCTRSGELILRLNRAAADTNINDVTFTVTTVELPEATPQRFNRFSSLSITPVVGDNDLQLYPSTIYAGLLLFSTTVPVGTAFTTSCDRQKLLLNNIEYNIAQANWEDLQTEWINRTDLSALLAGHLHREAATDTLIAEIQLHPLRRYAWIDFDPLKDGSYWVDARNIARVVLRFDADDANIVRVVPHEIVELAASS